MAFEAITVKRFWDASTNDLGLIAGKGVNGDAYLVVVAGATDLGQEGAFAVGDIVAFALDRWVRIPGSFDLSIYSTTAQMTAAIDAAIAAARVLITAEIAASTATAIETGDIKTSARTTASAGWLLLDGKTIGNAASGGTARAHADTAALFAELWNWANAQAAVSGGRGASAAADFAANKTIALPDFRGRVPAGMDPGGTAARLTTAGAGIDGKTIGVTGGAQTHILTTAQMPSHGHAVTDPTHNHNMLTRADLQTGGAAGAFASAASNLGQTTQSASSNVSIQNTGSDQGHQNTQPTIVVNYFIKL